MRPDSIAAARPRWAPAATRSPGHGPWLEAAVLLLVALPACGRGGQRGHTQTPAQAAVPALVTVTFIGVTVAPFKSGGTPWDAGVSPPPQAVGRLAKALGATSPQAAVVAVAALLGEGAFSALEKPEVFGTAELVANGTTVDPRSLRGARDTFTPTWRQPPVWRNVPTNGSVRIRVTLTDEDLAFDDPMGGFELTAPDFIAALQAGAITSIQVAAQNSNQILFAQISVQAAQ
jgi:hypothetical protein